jgi:hypothetical protein
MQVSIAQKAPSVKIHYTLSKELKAGNKYDLPVSISNTLADEHTGTIDFGIINPATGTAVDGWFLNIFPHQFFTGTPHKKFSTTFPFTIPADFKGYIKFFIKAECNGTVDSVTFTSAVKNNYTVNEK